MTNTSQRAQRNNEESSIVTQRTGDSRRTKGNERRVTATYHAATRESEQKTRETKHEYRKRHIEKPRTPTSTQRMRNNRKKRDRQIRPTEQHVTRPDASEKHTTGRNNTLTAAMATGRHYRQDG